MRLRTTLGVAIASTMTDNCDPVDHVGYESRKPKPRNPKNLCEGDRKPLKVSSISTSDCCMNSWDGLFKLLGLLEASHSHVK